MKISNSQPDYDADYIIIGGGTAGCVLANRLSENPKNKVILLEGGKADRILASCVPAGQALIVGNPKYDWGYKIEPDPTRSGAAEHWPAAKLMGGGSSVNGMFFVRGHWQDYEDWVGLGAKGWSYSDVLPFFQKSEKFADGNLAYRGDQGLYSVERIRDPHPLCIPFLKGAEEIGYNMLEDPNGIDMSPDGMGRVGFSYAQISQKRGWRASTAQSYLRAARNRRNLRVIDEATVQKVIFEGRRVTGVIYKRPGGKEELLRVGGEVILSAGTLTTPKLLFLSGVGSATHLKSVGMDVVHDLPGVGQNLREHIGAALTVGTNVNSLNMELKWHKIPFHGLNYLLFGMGPAATPIAHAFGYVKSRQGLNKPDAMIFLIPIAYEFGSEGQLSLSNEPAVSLATQVNYPRVVGEVKLRSANPSDAPIINFEMFRHEEDIETLVDALSIAHRIVVSKAFSGYLRSYKSPQNPNPTREEWRSYVQSSGYVFYHPVGTARMGQDEMAVVSPELRVHGIENLRVADASVMPRLPGANTNATTIMIGEKASDHILGRI